jgi:hypothetical protein
LTEFLHTDWSKYERQEGIRAAVIVGALAVIGCAEEVARDRYHDDRHVEGRVTVREDEYPFARENTFGRRRALRRTFMWSDRVRHANRFGLRKTFVPRRRASRRAWMIIIARRKRNRNESIIGTSVPPMPM